MNILGMSRAELLTLDPKSVHKALTEEEVLYIATMLGAFWQYNYDAAAHGWFGMHALLKSGLHSDGFFVSKILLEHENILRLIAYQVMMRVFNERMPRPDYVAGVPDGATKLGEMLGDIYDVPVARMKKNDGRIVSVTEIQSGETLLLVEDFCTRGTGFAEAVIHIRKKHQFVRFSPYNPCIINRGGLKYVSGEGVGDFKILPVVEKRIQDWTPEECPLCKMGSKPIKPKASDENWRLITTSQLQ